MIRWRARQRPVSSAKPRSAAPGRAVQGVVGLVVRGEELAAGGLFDRRPDALARTLVAGVGRGGQVELRRCPVQRADDAGRPGHGEVVQMPGRTAVSFRWDNRGRALPADEEPGGEPKLTVRRARGRHREPLSRSRQTRA